jgi:hypothetical protein
MHDTALVCRCQAEQRALQDDECGLRGGAALAGQDLAQRDTVDELHDDGSAGRRFHIFVEPDDVHVLHRGQNGRLAAEHLGEFPIGQQVTAQVLDGYQRA